jgi:hypothetical protein
MIDSTIFRNFSDTIVKVHLPEDLIWMYRPILLLKPKVGTWKTRAVLDDRNNSLLSPKKNVNKNYQLEP